ncbi:MAG TPA: hypothetical protein VK116_14725, partial [Planctomycetota bacterium]|nr:hypothetical protein [Planctomycetota bacterium]
SGRTERIEPQPRLSAPKTEPPAAWVREAITDYLGSSDSARRRRGELRLLHAGQAVVPQLRYWLERVRLESDRVEALLQRILAERGEGEGELSLHRGMALGDFYRRKLIEAKELLTTGQFREAHAIAEALLVLDPETPIAWELRRVQRDTRERIAREALEPRLDASENIYEIGETPKVTFRLINRTRNRARIELRDGRLGRLELSIETRTVSGAGRREERILGLTTDSRHREILLGPGEIWVQEVEVPKPDDLISIAGMVGRVKVSGEFRPFRWSFVDADKSAEENLTMSVPACELWFVPPALKRTLDDPLSSVVAVLFFDGKAMTSIEAGDPALDPALGATVGDKQETRGKEGVPGKDPVTAIVIPGQDGSGAAETPEPGPDDAGGAGKEASAADDAAKRHPGILGSTLERFLVAGQTAVWAAESDPVLHRKLTELFVAHLGALAPDRETLAILFLQELTGEAMKTPAEWQKWWEAIRGGTNPNPFSSRGAGAGEPSPEPSR